MTTEGSGTKDDTSEAMLSTARSVIRTCLQVRREEDVLVITDPETAEEVAQEAMISVWRKCEMYDASKSAASTWIFTIARNLRIDRFRKEKRPQLDPNDPSLLPEEETPADEQLDIDDRQVVIRNAVNGLPDGQREVVALSFIIRLEVTTL